MSTPDGAADHAELVAAVQSLGVDLTLRAHECGVVLEGVSHSYYGKQMAQELVRRAGFRIVANEIRVDRWRTLAGQGLGTHRGPGKP